MKRVFPNFLGRLSFLLVVVLAVSAFWPDAAGAQGSPKGILHRDHPLVQEAVAVQQRHLPNLMKIPGVVGAGVGIGADGQPVIRVFTARPEVPGIPGWLEFVPVQVEVTGMVLAYGDTTARYRPAPIGVSTGHPAITAGTIGARVKDTGGKVYALSNNHVYANQNEAAIGDSALQPGPYDGGGDTDYYRIATLSAFEPIDFTMRGVNYIDAAIAGSSVDTLGNSTLPDGYGAPSSEVAAASFWLPVKKYGRTTSLTHGTVSEIEVFVEVCYEVFYFVCVKSAYFYDQISISAVESGTEFSAGGDSGSLIVTEAGNHPVGLLFAGGSSRTFANRIDLVLSRFRVSIDGSQESTPPIAPSNLSATGPSGSQINLTWADNSGDESGFEIERCTGNMCSNFSPIAVVGADTTSYADRGLLTATAYTYRVRAYNSAGESGYSNVAVGKTLATLDPPEPPSGLSATVSGRTRVDLSWVDNSNNESGFKVERCSGSGCTNFKQIATVGASVNKYADTSVRRRTTYWYRVRAYNSAGNSGYSSPAEAITY